MGKLVSKKIFPQFQHNYKNQQSTMVFTCMNKRKRKSDAEKAAKKLKKDVVEELALKLIEHQEYSKENKIGRKESYGGSFYKLLHEKMTLMTWLTRDVVYQEASRIRKKKQKLDEESTISRITTSTMSNGRPKEITNESKVQAVIIVTYPPL